MSLVHSTLRLAVAAGASLSLGAAALAQESDDAEMMMAPAIGPAIGANIAETLAAQDQTGAERTFTDLTGYNGAVVMVSRSLDWCPFCKAQAMQIEQRVDEIFDAGYAMVVVTTDDVDKLARYAAQNETRMTLLADPDSEIVMALDLLDPSFAEGSRSYGLPYPTTLILSPEGEVRASLFEEELVGQNGAYRERIEAQDVIDAITMSGPES
ncbi:MAG: redoxin domain-containing protein [Maricaulaceae bacterium]|jgi:peroxiredoxin Q/BCP